MLQLLLLRKGIQSIGTLQLPRAKNLTFPELTEKKTERKIFREERRDRRRQTICDKMD